MVDDPGAKGRHVLVVEDELLIVLEIEDTLSGVGAEMVGPAGHLDTALHLAAEASLDAAILDVNIKGGNTFAVADVLAKRGIPFVFCTGYSEWVLEERHRDRPRLTKPYTSEELEKQVLHLLCGLSR